MSMHHERRAQGPVGLPHALAGGKKKGPEADPGTQESSRLTLSRRDRRPDGAPRCVGLIGGAREPAARRLTTPAEGTQACASDREIVRLSVPVACFAVADALADYRTAVMYVAAAAAEPVRLRTLAECEPEPGCAVVIGGISADRAAIVADRRHLGPEPYPALPGRVDGGTGIAVVMRSPGAGIDRWSVLLGWPELTRHGAWVADIIQRVNRCCENCIAWDADDYGCLDGLDVGPTDRCADHDDGLVDADWWRDAQLIADTLQRLSGRRSSVVRIAFALEAAR